MYSEYTTRFTHSIQFMLLLLLLLGVDVYRLGMSLSRPLAAPSTTVLSLAMSLATARHAAT